MRTKIPGTPILKTLINLTEKAQRFHKEQSVKRPTRKHHHDLQVLLCQKWLDFYHQELLKEVADGRTPTGV